MEGLKQTWRLPEKKQIPKLLKMEMLLAAHNLQAFTFQAACLLASYFNVNAPAALNGRQRGVAIFVCAVQ